MRRYVRQYKICGEIPIPTQEERSPHGRETEGNSIHRLHKTCGEMSADIENAAILLSQQEHAPDGRETEGTCTLAPTHDPADGAPQPI